MSSTSRLDEVFASQVFIAARYQSSALLHKPVLDTSSSTHPRTNNLCLGNKAITSGKNNFKSSYIPHRLPRTFFILITHRVFFLFQRTLYGKDESISEERVECSGVTEDIQSSYNDSNKLPTLLCTQTLC
jgi:hypothetical protein